MHVVILPGWQHNKTHWKDISDTLTASHIAHTVLDMPGFGEEPFQTELNTISSIAQWVQGRILQSIDDREIVLVGHSYGGRIAAYIASKQPAFCKALILVGSPNLYLPTIQIRIQKFIVHMLHPAIFLVPEALRTHVRSTDYQKVRGTKLQELFTNIIIDDQRELLHSIQVPTLLVWGQNDTDVPLRVAHEIKKVISHATLTVINNAGHNLHIEKSSLLAATITTYVKTI